MRCLVFANLDVKFIKLFCRRKNNNNFISLIESPTGVVEGRNISSFPWNPIHLLLQLLFF